MEKPKDIGLKIATKKEAMWMSIKEEALSTLEIYKKQLAIVEETLKNAEKIIQEEQCKK